jgi:aminoglycoside phosphotransferase (APT) family kinase protein
MSAEVVPVDVAALGRWLEGQGVGAGPVRDMELIVGGTQNILAAFTLDGRRLVLRRPPANKRPESDDVARREARVLAALGGTDVPHPRLVAACAQTDILGAAFHVAEHVDGFSFWATVPEPWSRDTASVREAGLQVVDGFAALARVVPSELGLEDLGRPDGWAARQPERWLRQLTSYGALDDRPGERLPGAADVHEWLVAHVPVGAQVGLVHGDAHLGNVLVRRDGTGVALVDWELATVGDPLLDLAQLLVTWPVDGGPYRGRVSVDGLPAADEVVERWAAASGRSTADLRWYRVLAAYRLAVLLEGTHARARVGLVPMATGELLHERACGLLAAARTETRSNRVGL